MADLSVPVETNVMIGEPSFDPSSERKDLEAHPEKIISTRRVDASDSETLKSILSLERNAFGDGALDDDAGEYYSERLRNPDNINILVDENGEAVGYLLAVPKSVACSDKELLAADPDFRDDSDGSTYYIETAEIRDGKRGLRVFLPMLRSLADGLREKGVTGISMHARVGNGLAAFTVRFLERSAELKESRIIDHWPFYEGDEPTMYIEAEDPTGTWEREESGDGTRRL